MYRFSFLLLLFIVHYASAQTDSLQRQINMLVQAKVDSLWKLKMDSLQKTTASKSIPAKPLLQFQLGVDGTSLRGNVRRDLLVIRSEWTVARGELQLDMSPRFSYGNQNGVLAERDFYTDLHLNLWHQRKVYTFALGSAENSNLRGISFRRLAGAGIGWHILRRPTAVFSITSAVIQEKTDFDNQTDIATTRSSTRFKGRYSFWNNRFSFKHLIFIQPSLQNDNLRWSAVFTLEMPLHKWLKVRANYENYYESIVLESRQNTDSRWTVGVVFGNKN
jgi:hypothetical protein